MLLSKLKNIYAVADYKEWLTFSKGVDPLKIDPLFLGRLAELCRRKGKKANILSGRRDKAKQIYFYKKSGGKLVNGVWSGGNGTAAKPGTSFHEFGLAIDTDTQWLKELDKDASTDMQKSLVACGLFKTLTVGNKTSVHEDWHIQPIETKGLGISQRSSLEPKEVEHG